MHCVCMPGQTRFRRECQPTSGALEGLLLEVDYLVVRLQIGLTGEGLAAGSTLEWLRLEVDILVMSQHSVLPVEHLATV